MTNSEPYFSKFIPFGYQSQVLRLIRDYDFGSATPEILLSGSVGSAKSILLAHIILNHCLTWPRAVVAIGRRSLPDLKRTLWKEILEHCEHSIIEGDHFTKRDNIADIKFKNGSEILSITWGDQRYAKFRSLKLSMLVIEELTENDDEFEAGFMILKGRLRRIPEVKENILICATNPGEPDSFWYKYFIKGSKEFSSRHVFYSNTQDNPHLDPVYYTQLRQDYSFLEAERYLRGKWISLKGQGIYSAYDPDVNYINESYKIDEDLPIRIAFDFNIAEKKPMSAVLFQYNPKRDHFHFFNESVVFGARTEDICEDIDSKGILDPRRHKIIIHGDATGRARSTQSKEGNYDIIYRYFLNRRYTFELDVPLTNPPIVTRHSKMNSYCKNDLGQVRLFVYKKAETMHEGMRLTKFKKGSNLVEDDSKPYQHITTAAGYGLIRAIETKDRKKQRSVQIG